MTSSQKGRFLSPPCHQKSTPSPPGHDIISKNKNTQKNVPKITPHPKKRSTIFFPENFPKKTKKYPKKNFTGLRLGFLLFLDDIILPYPLPPYTSSLGNNRRTHPTPPKWWRHFWAAPNRKLFRYDNDVFLWVKLFIST